jgi:hypothetical protein
MPGQLKQGTSNPMERSFSQWISEMFYRKDPLVGRIS